MLRALAPPVARSGICQCLWLQSASQWNPSEDPSYCPLSCTLCSSLLHCRCPGQGTAVGEGERQPGEERSSLLWKKCFFEGFSWQCQCVESEICSAVLNRQWHKPAASGSSFYPTAVGFYKWTSHFLFDFMFATDQATSNSFVILVFFSRLFSGILVCCRY